MQLYWTWCLTMNTLKKILTILTDGKFHTGEAIGKQLNLTRSAVWKALKSLDQLGLVVNSDTRKGYQLSGGLELLDEKKILSHLSSKTRDNITALQLFDDIDSTNTYLLENVNTLKSGTIVLAEHQSDGKGRRGRTWLSPFGKHIYFSMLWHFNKDSAELSGLSLVVAIAVCRAIKAIGIEHPIQLKWPNDIWANDKKCGGVLLEMLAEPHEVTRVVMGVGINVDFTGTTNNLDTRCTDMASLTKKSVSRNFLVAHLINQLMSAINTFSINGFKAFFDEWNALDCTKDKTVTLLQANKAIQGISQGVNTNGALLLSNTENRINTYVTGDVSLRLQND